MQKKEAIMSGLADDKMLGWRDWIILDWFVLYLTTWGKCGLLKKHEHILIIF